MKSFNLPCLLCLATLTLPSADLYAQVPAATATTPLTASPTNTAPTPNTLLDGTPVKLRLAETVSSADAKTGQQVPFEVVEDVKLQGLVVIAKGSTALATVTDAEHKKTMGRGGKLDLNVDSVRLVDNEKAALRATAGGKAGGHTGAMTGAMVATGILFFPAAPLFLFMHGKDLRLEKGLETTAFIEGDMNLNLQAFSPAGSGPGIVAGGAAATGMSQLVVDANVPNCDIDVDGSFAGNTPSHLSVPAGKHDIFVHKKGYAAWTRTMNVSGGEVHVQAELSPEAPAGSQ